MADSDGRSFHRHLQPIIVSSGCGSFPERVQHADDILDSCQRDPLPTTFLGKNHPFPAPPPVSWLPSLFLLCLSPFPTFKRRRSEGSGIPLAIPFFVCLVLAAPSPRFLALFFWRTTLSSFTLWDTMINAHFRLLRT